MISAKLNEKIRKLAESSYDLPSCRNRHFSFIVERNKIVSFGWNSSLKTHPLAAKFGHKFSSIHSELHAIKNFPYSPKELVHYDFINIRINRNHTYCLSKPCIHCMQLLIAFNIPKVIYSINNTQFGELYLVYTISKR
jgi:tRNA(Arg) A34 adenosine deaminase TadA